MGCGIVVFQNYYAQRNILNYALVLIENSFMEFDFYQYVVASKNKQMLETLAAEFEMATNNTAIARVIEVAGGSLFYLNKSESDYNYSIVEHSMLGGSTKAMEVEGKKYKKTSDGNYSIDELDFSHSLTVKNRYQLIANFCDNSAVENLIIKKIKNRARRSGKFYSEPWRYKNIL